MYRHILCNIHNIRLRPPRGLNLGPYFPILSEVLSHYHSIPLFTNMGCRFYQSIKKVLDFRSQVNVANGATLEEHQNSRLHTRRSLSAQTVDGSHLSNVFAEQLILDVW